jgi:hypothetical protein
MANSILLLRPYWHAGTWVFDDEATGLIREPFVSGVPEMIDRLVAAAGIAGAHKTGFRLLFSAEPFSGHIGVFRRLHPEHGGMWYRDEATGKDGWLCPALFKYFAEAPPMIYARAEPLG